MKTKTRDSGQLTDDWYCPNCNRWFAAWHESYSNGKRTTTCNRCGIELEEDNKNN